MEQTLNPSYNAALDFLYGFVDYERGSKWKYDDRNFNLQKMLSFLSVLDNPQNQGWFVHIAGTNGKGSVAAMIANALIKAGNCTGLYTSPHLIDFRERIRVNGYMITPGDVVAGVEHIKKAVKQFPGLTFFDVWTALAFDHFARLPVDAAVIEVGLGGRLDSTNVITPAVTVITSISVDHRDKLGNTLEKIAYEKAGILKSGVPVVSAPQKPEVIRILKKRAEIVGADFLLVGADVSFNKTNGGMNYRGLKWNLDPVSVPLEGSVQIQNAATAIAALELLASEGYRIDPAAVKFGIETLNWPGRLQTVSTHPEVVVDGACNTSAMSAVCEFIDLKKAKNKSVAVVGMCMDKDVKDVLNILGKSLSRFILAKTDNPRSMIPAELAELSPDSVETTVEPDINLAVQKAVSMAGTEGLVLVTGSLYLVGDVLRLFGVKEINKI